VVEMPRKVEGVKTLRELIQDQNGILRLLAEINRIEDVKTRETLIHIYNVIISLWMYWNVTHDEEVEWHMKYYEKKFFDILSKARVSD